MCGLLFSTDPQVSEARFKAALATMRHRGPDVPLCYTARGPTKLGHNRLKILDLQPRSNQPFVSRDGRHLLVYNGEIYNYRELAKRYDIALETTSDTELLLELYRRMGPNMLSHLNGMFAFVILDTVRNQIFVARDRLGVKPLYYAARGEYLYLASEIAALLPLLPSAKIDPIGLRQYRKLRSFFGGHTLYQDVRMFPAGHCMLNGQLKRYWSLPDDSQAAPTDDELRALVESAVAYRCISDVPVGSYLSGGLDSTIVAALSHQPHTWTVGFPEANEFDWARVAADALGTTHHEVVIGFDQFLDLARDLVQTRREPLSVPNEVLLYQMTKSVKLENTVILSGEGADELFFGYDRIFRWAMASPWDLGRFSELYSYGSVDDLDIVAAAVEPFMDRGSAEAIVAAFFQVAHLHGLLRRLDNSTMRCAVEGRVPFVDYRLVERLAGVAGQARMPGGEVKGQLKRIFADLIPESILKRKKVGFPVPLERIFPALGPGGTPFDLWCDFNLRALDLDQVARERLI